MKKIQLSDGAEAYLLMPKSIHITDNWSQYQYATVVDSQEYGQYFLLTPYPLTRKPRDVLLAIRECVGVQLDADPEKTELDLLDNTMLYSPVSAAEFIRRAITGHLEKYNAGILFVTRGRRRKIP